jgi:hypothetical protein
MPPDNDPAPEILRHRAAIRRRDLSLGLTCVLRDSLLDQADSLFDYGCGHGDDIRRLCEIGFDCEGWDPVHRPDVSRRPADTVVTLGYIGSGNPFRSPHPQYLSAESRDGGAGLAIQHRHAHRIVGRLRRPRRWLARGPRLQTNFHFLPAVRRTPAEHFQLGPVHRESLACHDTWASRRIVGMNVRHLERICASHRVATSEIQPVMKRKVQLPVFPFVICPSP